MRSQNVNYNSVGTAGRISCFLLLLLAFLVINPVTNSAYAEGDVADEAGVPEVQSSDPITSTVRFSFGEPVGVTSLTPTSVDGASAQYSIQATVGVENSGGYTVYLGSNKSELTGKNYGATINAVTSSSSYEDLPINSWGYNATEGTTGENLFQAVPTNNRGVEIGKNEGKNIKSDSKTFTLSFAAHIGNDKPADTYENEVTLSVVSSPLEITTDFGISTMQEMTAAICSGATDVDGDGQISAQLEDTRDGKYYWVSKLADNKCWMTQNLDLDLGDEWPDASKSDYSSANQSYTPVTTATTATAGTVSSDNTSTRSWSLGSYVITNPTASSDCGHPKNTFADCSSQFAAIGSRVPSSDANFYAKNGNKTFSATEYDAHYAVGNFYQWNAATAGTGAEIKSGQASSSICPKGWKLPTSGDNAVGSFDKLVSAASIGNSVSKLTASPYYYVRTGMVDPSVSYLFSHAGTYGLYWSSTPVTNNAGNAYRLSFNGTNSVRASEPAARIYGHSVRCIAR